MAIAGAWERVRDTVHPAAIRFRKFLRSLPLDPSKLPDHVPDLDDDDFVICGCPRTGTSLLAALLFQPPTVVTVVEPWDGLRLAPRELFADLRLEIERTRSLTRGTLDLPRLLAAHEVRRVPEGTGGTAVSTAAGWRLGVKWPTYFQLVRRMPDTKFIVCLRDPYDTVASFKAVGGSVRRGYEYDVAFNRRLNESLRASASTPAERRAALYATVHEELADSIDRPNVATVRYERWFSDADAQWAEVARFLGTDLDPITIPLRNDPKHDLLDDADRSAIKERCGVAERFGYSL